MKILILCPDHVPKSRKDISSFLSLSNYYIPRSLKRFCNCEIKAIPTSQIANYKDIRDFFSTYNFNGYDAILALGLRYFSLIPKDIISILRTKYDGLICQIYDGSRIKKDPVDITFTMKNDYIERSIKHWYVINKGRNIHIGWGADSNLNFPNQEPKELRILVDHPNYALNNPIDKSIDILNSLKKFHQTGTWKNKYERLIVRRFTSKKIVNFNFNENKLEKYEPSSIPYPQICEEHCKAHIFLVTHPESLGLVVLETALAGALVVTPKGFIAKDRLKTIRHYEYYKNIDWEKVLKMINIEESRAIALKNSWDKVASNIVNALKKTIK